MPVSEQAKRSRLVIVKDNADSEATHEPRPLILTKMRFHLDDDQKFLLGAIGVFTLLTVICLIFGAFFGWCDDRKIQKQEANIERKTNQVEKSEEMVGDAEREAAAEKGEVKVLKETIKENNVEVNRAIEKRNQAAANSNRVRRRPVRNVNGASLERILEDAERDKYKDR